MGLPAALIAEAFTDGSRKRRTTVLTGLILATRVLPAPTGSSVLVCYSVRFSGGQLLASRSSDGSIGSVNPSTGGYAPIARGALRPSVTRAGGSDNRWIFAYGSLWVDTNGTLVDIDARTRSVVARIRAGTAGGDVVADGQGSIWVLEPATGTLIRVSSRTRRISNRIQLSQRPSGVAAGAGRIWVALGQSM